MSSSKRSWKIFIAIMLVFIVGVAAIVWSFGQKLPANVEGSTLEEQVENYVNRYAEDEGFSGTVLVAKGEQILFHQSYGLSSIEEAVSNTNDTQYKVGSITKVITATAIAKLVHEGKLTLTDSVTRFFPDIPEWKDIQIQHLLSHSSGLNSFEFIAIDKLMKSDSKVTLDEIEQTLAEPATPSQQLESIRSARLSFVPGQEGEYKNSNYLLLGLIIEQLTGMSYGDYVRDHILIPAQMDSTVFDEASASGLAKPYSQGRSTAEATAETLYSFGGMISTAHDLFQFNRKLQTGQLIPMDQVQQMNTVIDFKRGYGWKVSNVFNEPSISHGGDTLGFASHLIYFPESEYIVIVLSNDQLNLPKAYSSQVLSYFWDAITGGGAHNLAADLAALHTKKRMWLLERMPGAF